MHIYKQKLEPTVILVVANFALKNHKKQSEKWQNISIKI